MKEEALPEERSGSIEKKDGKYIITVNKSHHPNRKRFTIAHEIGHYIFHSDYIELGAIVDDKLYRDERVGGENETQANKFAASILMPESLIKCLMESGVNTIDGLARELQVSEQAMAIRVGSLNIPEEPQEPINV